MGQLTYTYFYDLLMVLQNLICSRFMNKTHGLVKYHISHQKLESCITLK